MRRVLAAVLFALAGLAGCDSGEDEQTAGRAETGVDAAASPRAAARPPVDAVSERRRTVNVIAEIAAGRGRRVVMAGGHLDSVPEGPGINDNASGTAALLELAEALRGRAPGARIRLAFWGAEELGLIGSTPLRALARADGGAGVRMGGLFTGAGRPHDPCYHRACDDIANVDMPILVRMARAAGEAVERLSARN